MGCLGEFDCVWGEGGIGGDGVGGYFGCGGERDGWRGVGGGHFEDGGGCGYGVVLSSDEVDVRDGGDIEVNCGYYLGVIYL